MKKKAKLFFTIMLITLSLIMPINSFQGGDGTLGDPYQISTCEELQNMSACLACNYTLMQDVNCGVPPYNTGSGFLPIGNCTGDCLFDGDDFPFDGNFDGNNKNINNLFINRPTQDNIGLFSYVSDGNITNLGLTNIEVYGRDYVGGLIGYNDWGYIENSYVTGNVNGVNSVGGLVGISHGEIISSFATGNVNGSLNVGGLLGGNYGHVDNCYATGNVEGVDYVGGLIGSNVNDIDNSYTAGGVNGVNYVGGLTGINDGHVFNCFTASQVNGVTNAGGLIGYYFFGPIANTYWNNVSSNLNSTFGTGSTGGTFTIQDNTSYFYDCSNDPMDLWDLTNEWTCSGTAFPILAWQSVPAPASSGKSTSMFPFQETFIVTIMVIFAYLFLN